MKMYRRLGILAISSALLLAPTIIPADAPVPPMVGAEAANSSAIDCLNIADSIHGVTGGSPGGVNRLGRAVGGCVSTARSATCWASREWWGGFARWVIRRVTGGRYSTC